MSPLHPRITALAALLLLATAAEAEPRRLIWQNPTTYEDNSPLALTELERFQIGCGPTAGDRTDVSRTWVGVANPTGGRTYDFAVGTWFCALRVRAIKPGGAVSEYSDWSNEVSFTVSPPTPKPVAPASLRAE